MNDAVLEAALRDIRRLKALRRREIANRLLDAMRAVQEETGYGAIEDAVTWAARIVEGRGE
jgi:hypothetical protein